MANVPVSHSRRPHLAGPGLSLLMALLGALLAALLLPPGSAAY